MTNNVHFFLARESFQQSPRPACMLAATGSMPADALHPHNRFKSNVVALRLFPVDQPSRRACVKKRADAHYTATVALCSGVRMRSRKKGAGPARRL